MGYLLWTPSNPGVGTPADIRAAASMRVSDAQTARSSATALTTGREGLQGSTADALASRVEMIRAEMLSIAAQHDTDAGALSRYATELERIQASQRTIEAEEDTLKATTRRLLDEATALRSQRRSWAQQDRDDKVWQLDHQLMVNGQQSAFATAQMQGLSRRMDALAEERRIADAACVASLTSPDARGGLGSAPGTPGILTAGVTLSGLSQMSQLDILTLLQARPDALDELTSAAPEDIAEWWAGLTLDQQTALVVAAPTVIGALNGIPVMARVGANRLVARDQLDKDRAYLMNWEAKRAGEDGPDSNPGFWEGQDKRIAEVEERVRYLERVLAGDVQLYLYNHDQHRIIQMLGTPGPNTYATVTYSPGTFTTERSLYGDDVQKVSRWLTTQDDGIVAFVWKDGLFPGAANPGDTARGLMEANDVDMALAAGRRMAAFHEGMLQDPTLAGTKHVGIGHSWGFAAITSSENAGVKYDQVESLAGAYVPPGWAARDGIPYHHQSYTDFLSIAQDIGVVGERRNPDVTPGIESLIIKREGDFTVFLPSPGSVSTGGIGLPPQAPVGIDATVNLEDNHTLIASSHDDNRHVLDRVLERVQEE